MSMQFEKNMSINHNVRFNIIDRATGIIVRSYEGHNQATNSMLLGMAHYLCGDGILNQGYDTLSMYIPRYISLGTMGLINQDSSTSGLPLGIGTPDTATQGSDESDYKYKVRRYTAYMNQTPGYGSDGYRNYQSPTSDAYNNDRLYYGLGPKFVNRADQTKTINCELISDSFPRVPISYRSITPENKASKPQTIDVVFSGMISTGALAQFREPAPTDHDAPNNSDHIFITEAGLWSTPTFSPNGAGLIAGYRIAPPNENNWDMSIPANQKLLEEQIIRVGINQVVQVVWKVQIGSLSQLTSRVYDTSVYVGKMQSFGGVD